jgi:protein-ribulosamine 3-kinase
MWIDKVKSMISVITTENVDIKSYNAVGGGSINETYKVLTTSGNYFVKLNSASAYPQMFEKEALGIRLLKSVNEIDVPDIIGYDEIEDQSILLMKFIDSGSITNDFWNEFGNKLAMLHKHSSNYFGLDHDNYIGSLNQVNRKHDNWSDFFINERLGYQVKLARDNSSIDRDTVNALERFYQEIDNIFPVEPSAMLHGDLWSGNFMVNILGKPVIIDPAVYYGHREMDLGMSKLFGGFDSIFYQSYNRTFPLEKGWESRLQYCNLYPLMVHVNLFGASYLQSVKDILRKF